MREIKALQKQKTKKNDMIGDVVAKTGDIKGRKTRRLRTKPYILLCRFLFHVKLVCGCGVASVVGVGFLVVCFVLFCSSVNEEIASSHFFLLKIFSKQ